MPDPIRPLVATTTRADTGQVCAQCAARPASAETQADGFICQRCASLNYIRCPGCRTLRRLDCECRACVTCDRCDQPAPASETIDTLEGSTICPSCRGDWYRQCESCAGWNREGRDCANRCTETDDEACDDCDCDECCGELIHCYDYKPRPVFRGTGSLFFGLEIEIETSSTRDVESAQIARSYLGGLGYLKADSSIGYGFEIVTHPMSYPWAMANFPWGMLGALARVGCQATERTGLHVHISRAGFASPCHTYRWIKFIYRNQPQVTALARRRCPQWAAFSDDGRRSVIDVAKGARGGTRYRAINAGNRDTLELRVFASSLDPTEVQAALGLAAASVEYTRHLSVPAITKRGGWGWPAFVAWLAEQPGYEPIRVKAEAAACAC